MNLSYRSTHLYMILKFLEKHDVFTLESDILTGDNILNLVLQAHLSIIFFVSPNKIQVCTSILNSFEGP